MYTIECESIHVYGHILGRVHGFPINGRTSTTKRNNKNRFSSVLYCARFSKNNNETHKRTEGGRGRRYGLDTDHHNVIPWNRILSHHHHRNVLYTNTYIYTIFFIFPYVVCFFFASNTDDGDVNKPPPNFPNVKAAVWPVLERRRFHPGFSEYANTLCTTRFLFLRRKRHGRSVGVMTTG